MNLDRIKEAADGLLFISESDYPFEVLQLDSSTADMEAQLLVISGQEKDSPIEQQDLDYFFRNMIKTYPGASAAQQQTAQRFQELLRVLKEELSGITVYRIGEVQVDAFVTGKGKEGSFVVLKTILIET